MIGFLRLLTNRAIMGDSTMTVEGALDLYDRWHRDPRVELAPEPPQTDSQFRKALRPIASQSSTKAIADCYLIGFASAGGAHIVTLDKGLASMSRAQKTPVTLIRPVPPKGAHN